MEVSGGRIEAVEGPKYKILAEHGGRQVLRREEEVIGEAVR